ncbi:MAG TPA: IPT/TIG domain-containing protein [Bryobacteraceae bacterium]|jgi:uncharacterized protein (TIGR03437 family)|nr:IPT/TIG domain-containing protein [Bryobacteraceae bacterium]
MRPFPQLLCLALFTAPGAMAASTGFLLGADYSELASFLGPIATDASGALYGFSYCQVNTPPAYPSSPPCVTKLSADGQTILWQNTPGVQFNSNIAVDPNGGVYFVPLNQTGPNASTYVVKLTGGTGVAWTTPITSAGTLLDYASIAADAQGRAYVAGLIGPPYSGSAVVRLNAAGTAIDYTLPVPGQTSAIAVDGSGNAFVVGNPSPYLARIAPDGSPGFNTPLPQLKSVGSVAVDPKGNPVVLGVAADGSGLLLRFDSTGAVTLSQTIASPTAAAGGFSLAVDDASGNAYVTGSTYVSDRGTPLLPVKNTILGCGSAEWLSVFAPDGSLLQTTYTPPGNEGAVGAPKIAVGPNTTVFLVHSAGSTFGATQGSPFQPVVPLNYLWRLSPNPNAQTLPLACIGSSISYLTGAIAPGSLVTLFGTGLGPQQGVQLQGTLANPYPAQAAGVTVTFDGTPAPLLWVQDAQINVVVPWALTPGQNTSVCVTYNSTKTNCLSWPVVQTAPVVLLGSDAVHALALNQDGSLNSATNPAPPGSIITVFGTGFGPITPPQADGTLVGFPLPTNVLPTTAGFVVASPPFGATIFNPFEVTYAGPAPYLVAGTSQINFSLGKNQGDLYTYNGQANIYLGSQPFAVYVANQ